MARFGSTTVTQPVIFSPICPSRSLVLGEQTDDRPRHVSRLVRSGNLGRVSVEKDGLRQTRIVIALKHNGYNNRLVDC